MEHNIKKYIQMIVTNGLNVKPGDRIFVITNVSIVAFTRRVVKALYAAGAVEVHVEYNDDMLAWYKGLYAEDALFDVYPQNQKVLYDELYAKRFKTLMLNSPNPEAMASVDSNRLMRYQKVAAEGMKDYRMARMEDLVNWSIAAVPNVEWARKVYPDASHDEAAMAKLWDAILTASHVQDGQDVVVNWQRHCEKLQQRVKTLNELTLQSLHYTNSLGTNLIIELPAGHKWFGGGATNSINGEIFAPNIPTEEVYTLADAHAVNGVLYSSMPLLNNGQLIEGIKLEFIDGAVVQATAKKGNALLQDLLAIDDGAKRLGEVALVPFDSPISRMNTIFYTTLFDENASCHFALGAAYPTTLPDLMDKSKEEQIAGGMNHSLIHVDFMVGTADLAIVGTDTNGATIQIFKNGNFVI